jgi:hypothetical protein
MEANASDGSQAIGSPSKSKKKRNIAIIVGVIGFAIAAVVILLAVNAGMQTQRINSFEASDVHGYQSLLGPTTFYATVTNNGATSSYASLTFVVDEGNLGSWTNSQVVPLDAGASTTVTIEVPTPYGTTVTSEMYSYYFA